MRQYEGLWKKIKIDKKVTVEVHAQLVGRVRKAVIKEKHADIGFKVINERDYLFLDITVVDAPKKKSFCHITFQLRQRYGLEDIKVS